MGSANNMVNLHDLADDVLLEISSHLALRDLISLKQTSRALRTLADTDYLWHQLATKCDLPLQLTSSQPLTSCSSRDLQQAMLKATQLDRNWRRPSTVIKTLSCFTLDTPPEDAAACELRICDGGRWLVSAVRASSGTSTFSFWSLENVRKVTCACKVQALGRYKLFSVHVDEAHQRAWLAMTSYTAEKESIQIYDISLGIHPEAETPSTYLYSLVWSSDMLSALPGSFNTLTISANIAAAVSFDDVQLSQSILLYNVVTRQESLVQMTCHALRPLNLKVYLDKLVVTQTHKDFVDVEVYQLPDPSEWEPVTELRAPLLAHRIILPSASDTRVAHTLGVGHSRFAAFMAFDLGIHLHCAQLPLEGGEHLVDRDSAAELPPSTPSVHILRMPEMTVVEALAVGARRSAWLEHNWETDEYCLMKFWWEPSEGGPPIPKKEVLIAPDASLPIQPAEVCALALDEAMGRMCLLSSSGYVYILDFSDG